MSFNRQSILLYVFSITMSGVILLTGVELFQRILSGGFKPAFLQAYCFSYKYTWIDVANVARLRLDMI